MVVIYRLLEEGPATSSAQNTPPKKDGKGRCYGKTRNWGANLNGGRQPLEIKGKSEYKIFRLETEEEELKPVRIKIQLGGTCNSARAKAVQVNGH